MLLLLTNLGIEIGREIAPSVAIPRRARKRSRHLRRRRRCRLSHPPQPTLERSTLPRGGLVSRAGRRWCPGFLKFPKNSRGRHSSSLCRANPGIVAAFLPALPRAFFFPFQACMDPTPRSRERRTLRPHIHPVLNTFSLSRVE